MKLIINGFMGGILSLALLLGMSEPCLGKIAKGNQAPLFSAQDIHGKKHHLSADLKHAMMILYFFDASSSSNREGLKSLNQIVGKDSEKHITVWAVTRSPADQVTAFTEKNPLKYPVMMDASGIDQKYQVGKVLPAAYILGPDLKVLDYYEGGGKYISVMLTRLADGLVHSSPALAKKVTQEAEKADPENPEPKAVEAMADIREGRLDKAEKISKELARKKGEGEVLSKEILATVQALKGDVDKAMKTVNELKKIAPQRGHANRVEGDILTRQKKVVQAKAAYQKGIQKKEGLVSSRAELLNQYGRFLTTLNDYKSARHSYDQALALDPSYIEATSNKGVAFEKEGQWDKALAAYQKAINLNKEDYLAVSLAKRAQEMVALQKDSQRRKRVDKLVKELAARYRNLKESGKKIEDDWTSRPMILTFVDFEEKGGLSERDGMSTVMTLKLGEKLNASGRVQVVERVVMDRLLEELNLGSSELANPETALRLGKVLAAKLIGTGSLYFTPEGSLLNMRLIDTETTAIPKVITRQFSSRGSVETELNHLNREILKSVIQKYPLQGFVVQMDGNTAMINIGSDQGVVLGTEFDILGAGKEVVYKGKTLKGKEKTIATIKVSSVEPGFSYAEIVSKEQLPKRDDKIREKIKG